MPDFEVNERLTDRRARCVDALGRPDRLGRAGHPLLNRHARLTLRQDRLPGSPS
jgi:hypothetical protein